MPNMSLKRNEMNVQAPEIRNKNFKIMERLYSLKTENLGSFHHLAFFESLPNLPGNTDL